MNLNRIVDYFVGRPYALLGLFAIAASTMVVSSVYYGEAIVAVLG